MQTLLEPAAHSNLASIAVSTAVILASAAGVGVLPRIGPLRAFVLGVSTKWAILRRPVVECQRVKEVAELSHTIKTRGTKQYVVVTGPKAVGKTTLVNYALLGHPGVRNVHVKPASSSDVIVHDALKAVAEYANVGFLDVHRGAARVAKWHRRLFSAPPTIVLRVPERAPGVQAASVGAAARELTEDYDLNLVVDSSDPDLHAMALITIRQEVVQVEPMERQVLEALPQLQGLLRALKEKGMADLAWSVLGGNPAHYESLRTEWAVAAAGHTTKTPVDVTPVAEEYLTRQLWDAAIALNEAGAAHPHLKEGVYGRFKSLPEGEEWLPASTRGEYAMPSPSYDRVLRMTSRQGKAVLVPATPAMGLVLRYGDAGEPPSLDVVRKALLRGLPALLP